LDGIRSGFGLFSHFAKPKPARETDVPADHEENLEEEALTDHSPNPETAAAEPVKAVEAVPEAAPVDKTAETVPVAATEPVAVADPAPVTEAAAQPESETISTVVVAVEPPAEPAQNNSADEPPNGTCKEDAAIEPTSLEAEPEEEPATVIEPEALPAIAAEAEVVEPEPQVEPVIEPAAEEIAEEAPLPDSAAEAEPEAEPIAEDEAVAETESTAEVEEAQLAELADVEPGADAILATEPEVESPDEIATISEPTTDEAETERKAEAEVEPELSEPEVEAVVEPEVEAEETPAPDAVVEAEPETEPEANAEPVAEAGSITEDKSTAEMEEAPVAESAGVEPEANATPVAEPEAESPAETTAISESADEEPEADATAKAEPVEPASEATEAATAPESAAVPAQKAGQSQLFQEEKPAEQVPAPLKSHDNSNDLSPFSVIVAQVYDGPLDLLLDLIRKQDIDIYDIPISKITAQFLAYVNQLKAGDMDVAGEFIYTASLLIHIKSKMLLPRAPSGPDDAAEDPRRELVERLLEHERFKNAAQMLQQKQMLEAATWTNPGLREFRGDEGTEPEIAADTVDLVRIFREILERARNRPMINVEENSVTVGQMIQFLARRLTMQDKPVALRRLLSHTHSERALIAMFLALLELVRLQAILLRQDLAFSEIFIKKNTSFETVMNERLSNVQDEWK
jgi:segregation and condensation protein A